MITNNFNQAVPFQDFSRAFYKVFNELIKSDTQLYWVLALLNIALEKGNPELLLESLRSDKFNIFAMANKINDDNGKNFLKFPSFLKEHKGMFFIDSRNEVVRFWPSLSLDADPYFNLFRQIFLTHLLVGDLLPSQPLFKCICQSFSHLLMLEQRNKKNKSWEKDGQELASDALKELKQAYAKGLETLKTPKPKSYHPVKLPFRINLMGTAVSLAKPVAENSNSDSSVFLTAGPIESAHWTTCHFTKLSAKELGQIHGALLATIYGLLGLEKAIWTDTESLQESLGATLKPLTDGSFNRIEDDIIIVACDVVNSVPSQTEGATLPHIEKLFINCMENLNAVRQAILEKRVPIKTAGKAILDNELHVQVFEGLFTKQVKKLPFNKEDADKVLRGTLDDQSLSEPGKVRALMESISTHASETGEFTRRYKEYYELMEIINGTSREALEVGKKPWETSPADRRMTALQQLEAAGLMTLERAVVPKASRAEPGTFPS